MRRMLAKTLVIVGTAGVIISGWSEWRLGAQGNPDAAKVKNPVAATPASLMRGQSEYNRLCANCHGLNAKGGPGNDLTPPAPDLTGQLTHGSSDGEIFYIIKNGVGPDFNMGAWGQQGVSDQDIWNIINYMKTLRKNQG